MIRYLTRWALKADKRSLKSWYIRGYAFQGVGGEGDFSNRVHPLMHRSALPVAVLGGLHFLMTGVLVDRLFHATILAPVATRREVRICHACPAALRGSQSLGTNR